VLAIAMEVVHPTQRGRAMGLIATLGPIGSVAGPGLGGLLISGPGWRWIFVVNVPICLLAIALAWRWVPSRGRVQGVSLTLLKETTLAGAGALALMLGLSHAATDGWWTPMVVSLLASAAIAWLMWGRLPSSRPAVGLLRQFALTGQLVILLVGATSMGAAYFLMSFFLQGPLKLSAYDAGVVFLVLPLALAATSQIGGRLADRIGTRIPTTLGLVVIIAGGLLLLPLQPDWTRSDIVWRLAVIGIGSGLLAGPNMTAIMTAAPFNLMATVSGLSGLARTLGFALGPALATVLWSNRQLTASAMRPAFALLAILPTIALAAALVTPIRSPRATSAAAGAPTPTPTRGGESLVDAD
jgi:DHA2 family multidrug resistance protein-like MFS transporter